MHVLDILNAMKEGNDWRKALYDHIPKRKVKPVDVVLKEEEQRRILFLRRKLSIETDHFNLDKIKEKFT